MVNIKYNIEMHYYYYYYYYVLAMLLSLQEFSSLTRD